MRSAVVAFAVLGCVGAAQAATKRYTLIVANRTSLSERVRPLDYADDDGARYWELFTAAGDDASLYTVLDDASQRLYPAAARSARPPTRQAVLDGLAAVFARAHADVARGDEVIFTFVLVGHGEIGAGGEAYVSLLDGRFTRTDLFHEVLAKSPATVNHVIVDACNSYFLVRGRGGNDVGPSQREAVSAFLAEESLARHPNTGVLLSTSAAKESHEWTAYGAGVFSHELRSALAGAADVNGDGRVEYSEIEAFVAAANLRIDDPRARVEIYARAPALDRSRPVIDLASARFRHWLRLPAGLPLRFHLEDARGVRYLDANLGGGHAVVLALVASNHYYLRSDDGARELRISLGAGGRVDVQLRRMRHALVAARGAIAESFRLGLFAVPYGADFYQGFVGRAGESPVDFAAPTWMPPAQRVDGSLIAGEIDRLNEAAANDASLTRRLRRAAPALLRALEATRYPEALRVLEEAERGD